MDARLREKIAEAIKVARLEGVTVNIVIADHYYLDVFHLARGLREDGSERPEGSLKNFGGDLHVRAIEEYVDGNPGFEEQLSELDLKDPEDLKKLGGTAELWQESGFAIAPRDFDKLFPVLVRHIPDRDLGAEGVVHSDFFFGISSRYFAEKPRLQEVEIHSSTKISIHEIERPDEKGRVYATMEYGTPEGEQKRKRVRVSPIHAEAISITYKKIRGEQISTPVVCCKVVEYGGYCVICKKRGEAKNAPRRGVDQFHIPREKPAPVPVPKPEEIFDEETWTTDDDGLPDLVEQSQPRTVPGKPDTELNLPSDPKEANAAIRAKLEEIRSRHRRPA